MNPPDERREEKMNISDVKTAVFVLNTLSLHEIVAALHNSKLRLIIANGRVVGLEYAGQPLGVIA